MRKILFLSLSLMTIAATASCSGDETKTSTNNGTSSSSSSSGGTGGSGGTGTGGNGGSGTAGAGTGGSMTGTGGAGTGGSMTGTGGAGTGGGGMSGSFGPCPPEAPTLGEACGDVMAVCCYGPETDPYYCTGTWKHPNNGKVCCPAAEPTLDAACNVPGVLTCCYGANGYACQQNKWATSVTQCN